TPTPPRPTTLPRVGLASCEATHPYATNRQPFPPEVSPASSPGQRRRPQQVVAGTTVVGSGPAVAQVLGGRHASARGISPRRLGRRKRGEANEDFQQTTRMVRINSWNSPISAVELTTDKPA